MSSKKTIGSVVGDGIDGAIGTVASIGKGAVNTVKGVDTALAGVAGYTLDVANGAAQKTSQAVDAVDSGVQNVAKSAGSLVVNGAKSVGSAVSKGFEKLQERGTEFKTGTIVKGAVLNPSLEKAFDANKDKIQNTVGSQQASSNTKSLGSAEAKAVEL